MHGPLNVKKWKRLFQLTAISETKFTSKERV